MGRALLDSSRLTGNPGQRLQSWAFASSLSDVMIATCALFRNFLFCKPRRSVRQVQVERELAKLGPTLELKQIGQFAATIKKLRRDLGKSHAFYSKAFWGAVISAEHIFLATTCKSGT